MGAVTEPVGLVARLHDVVVMGEPVQKRCGHLGINKNGRPFREAQFGGDHHAGELVQLRELVNQQGTAGSTEGQIAQLIQTDQIDALQRLRNASCFAPVRCN